MFIWEPTCESWSRPEWFENRAEGSDQLSQEGSQINIIADKTHAITIITIIHNGHVDLSLINKKDEISRLDLPVVKL